MHRLAFRSLAHLFVTLLIISETVALAFAPVARPAAAPVGQEGSSAAPLAAAPVAPAGANTILIGDGGFSPSSLTVTVGQEVTWVNGGTAAYSVASGLVSHGPYLLFLPVTLKPPALLNSAANPAGAALSTLGPSAVPSGVEITWRSGFSSMRAAKSIIVVVPP